MVSPSRNHLWNFWSDFVGHQLVEIFHYLPHFLTLNNPYPKVPNLWSNVTTVWAAIIGRTTTNCVSRASWLLVLKQKRKELRRTRKEG